MQTYPIKSYSKADLTQLAAERWFWQIPNLPFDRLRLQQYLKNPNAAEDDILWLFAQEEQRIIAYMGLIPDQVLLAGVPRKFCWFTSWWVDESYRGTGLGDALVHKGFELYPLAAVNSGTPISIGKVLRHFDMQKYCARPRCYYQLNLNARVLQDFGIHHRLLHNVLPLIQPLLSVVMKARLKAWQKRFHVDGIQVEYLVTPDQESLSFLQSFWKHDFAFKTEASFAWRIHNLVQSPRLKGIEAVPRTYFGNPGFALQNLNLKLVFKDEMIAYLNLVIADAVLKFPYFYLKPGYEQHFVSWLADVVYANGIQAIYSQHPFLVALLRQYRFPKLVPKSYPMPVVISKPLAQLEPGKIVQDGDGAF
ncbi:MAG: hypothetical protein PWP64_488 [Candidatus Cloacimonadota bacterium]|nr:hypothetical protein [Candidatus Cloacimonadota bacterium]